MVNVEIHPGEELSFFDFNSYITMVAQQQAL